MNHLDEGTVHAWLDGALDATHSREIEAHVAGCATCASVVAEARGLIAGASRILGALDDVPAGVIPGGAPAAPSMTAAAAPSTAAAALPMTAAASPPRTAARLKPRGQWRVARWASGIAAVLVGAVVLSTAHKADRPTEMTPPATEPAPQRVTRALTPPPENPATGAGAASGTVTAARSRELASVRNEQAKAEAVAPDRARAPGVASEPGQLSAAVTPMRVETRDSTRMRRVADPPVALGQVVVTSTQVAGLSDADVEGFAGCYRIDARAETAQVSGVAAGSVGGVERRRAAAPRPAPAAPSAAAAADRADFSSGGIALIRLDTARVAGLRRAVRTPSDSVIGSWSVVGDSIRVDLTGRGVVVLTPQRRIDCH